MSTHTCPNCGAPIGPQDEKCSYCGSALYPEVPDQEPEASVADDAPSASSYDVTAAYEDDMSPYEKAETAVKIVMILGQLAIPVLLLCCSIFSWDGRDMLSDKSLSRGDIIGGSVVFHFLSAILIAFVLTAFRRPDGSGHKTLDRIYIAILILMVISLASSVYVALTCPPPA